MPTYEYRCPSGHEFEHFVLRISEAKSAMVCPTCKKLAERIISAGGGLVFKGSGFYITDYGKDGKKDQRTKAPVAAGAESSGKSDASAKAAESGSKSGESGSKSSESGSKSGEGGSKSGESGSKPAAATESRPAAKPESKAKPDKSSGGSSGKSDA